jgi:hypothetical protein
MSPPTASGAVSQCNKHRVVSMTPPLNNSLGARIHFVLDIAALTKTLPLRRLIRPLPSPHSHHQPLAAYAHDASRACDLCTTCVCDTRLLTSLDASPHNYTHATERHPLSPPSLLLALPP